MKTTQLVEVTILAHYLGPFNAKTFRRAAALVREGQEETKSVIKSVINAGTPPPNTTIPPE